MHNRCSVCNATGISMCLIDGHQIDVCKDCGAVFITDLNLIVQLKMPLAYDNNLYAVALGIASVYKHLSNTAVPMSE